MQTSLSTEKKPSGLHFLSYLENLEYPSEYLDVHAGLHVGVSDDSVHQ